MPSLGKAHQIQIAPYLQALGRLHLSKEAAGFNRLLGEFVSAERLDFYQGADPQDGVIFFTLPMEANGALIPTLFRLSSSGQLREGAFGGALVGRLSPEFARLFIGALFPEEVKVEEPAELIIRSALQSLYECQLSGSEGCENLPSVQMAAAHYQSYARRYWELGQQMVAGAVEAATPFNSIQPEELQEIANQYAGELLREEDSSLARSTESYLAMRRMAEAMLRTESGFAIYAGLFPDQCETKSLMQACRFSDEAGFIQRKREECRLDKLPVVFRDEVDNQCRWKGRRR